jgi:hypothetical protein
LRERLPPIIAEQLIGDKAAGRGHLRGQRAAELAE